MLLLLSIFLAAPPTPQPKPALPMPRPEPAVTGPILDRLRMFSPAAATAAAKRIAALEEAFGYQLVIETMQSQADMSHLKGWFNRSERELEIHRWARKKADEAGVTNGLYVAISKQPPDVRVAGWPDEAELTFPPFMRQRLREDVRAGLRDNPDGALGAALDRFGELVRRVKLHPNPLETVPLLIVLGSLVGGWLVLFVVRRRLAGPTGLPLYPPAMQGSIFGSPAGMWINDQLYRAEGPVAPAPAPAAVPEEAKPA